MRITPLDIKKQEFQSKFRGFDKDEVISFLELVSEEMEELVRDNLEYKEKLQRAQDKLVNYTRIETALQNTLVATQDSAEQMRASAEEKAELIVREANSQAEKIIDDAYEKSSKLRREFISLKSQRAAFLVNFRSLIESQLKLLELMEKEAEERPRVLRLKKRPEIADAEVDRVVEQFKREVDPNTEETVTVSNTSTENSDSNHPEE